MEERVAAGDSFLTSNPTSHVRPPCRPALALHQAISRKTDPAWQVCGIPGVPSGEFNDPDVIATVARATAGNLRLVRHLLREISRILEVNKLASVTKEAVENRPAVSHHRTALSFQPPWGSGQHE
jgi:hypothetical protein